MIVGAGSGLVSLAEIEDAARRLDRVAVRTPLVPLAGVDPPLLLKPESLQPTGSFKLRGAYNAITTNEQAARQRGVVAHSSGNHGLAVAYAAAVTDDADVVATAVHAGDHRARTAVELVRRHDDRTEAGSKVLSFRRAQPDLHLGALEVVLSDAILARLDDGSRPFV